MKINNWLKRKYPHHYKIINLIFSEAVIKQYLKVRKYKLAILLKEVEVYQVGTLFLVKKSGHMEETGWDGTYDIFGLFNSGIETASGYNHRLIYDEDYYYIIE